ncbi:MAG: hypothetical protein LBG06_10230, partial [Deltaproteobacteria bacterium]|nr:hypothetical protein [Deltaproteobacteria bacterium]
MDETAIITDGGDSDGGQELLTARRLERPIRPFRHWLNFRTGSAIAPAEEDVAIPASGDHGSAAAICFMMHGFFGYAREVYGLRPEDYEVWFVDRLERTFMRLKAFGAEEVDPGERFHVPWWGRVPAEWPTRDGDPDAGAGPPAGGHRAPFRNPGEIRDVR